MKKREFIFQEIGVIHSPHKVTSETPIQPVFCQDIKGSVILFEEYLDGLKDLEDFSHIYLFYYFDRSQKTALQLKPYLSDNESGIFATRAPHRPNKLGMSLVRLDKIEGNVLYIRDLDILDGTPLLDIKPYIQRFDSRDDSKSGWQEDIQDETAFVRGRRNYPGNEDKS
jgi:tRNA-Thr(GGU) m(6)t(6)A37 methyltransferase TsaA